MKKALIIMLLLLSIVTTACNNNTKNSDDEKAVTNSTETTKAVNVEQDNKQVDFSKKILGTWYFLGSVRNYGKENESVTKVGDIFKYNFRDDGTYTVTHESTGKKFECKYSINDDIIDFDPRGDNESTQEYQLISKGDKIYLIWHYDGKAYSKYLLSQTKDILPY